MNKFFHKWFQKPLVISSFFISIPILYVYKSHLYSFVRSLLIKENEKKENILTQTDQYIERNKQIFLEQLDKRNILNSNVQKEFYNKESYKKEVEDINNNLEEIWKKKILIENTPRGNIYMYYDAYKMGFAYYSDTNSLPYKLLNAVAMKYCIRFHCVDFFIDQHILPKDCESPFIKIHHIEKKKKKKPIDKEIVKDDDLPFAKLKNYEKEKISGGDKKEEKVKNIVSNVFISMGKVINFQPLFIPMKKSRSVQFESELIENLNGETSLQKEVLNYKNFKNQFLSSLNQ
mgnify:CR=1 FL=1